LSEKENEKEDKPKNYTIKPVEVMTVMDEADSISTISGSLRQGFAELRGTFNVNQNKMAKSLNFDQNLEYLKKIAEELEKSRKLAEEQRDEQSKTQKEKEEISISRWQSP
jgi:hypothetical protein